MFELTRQEQAIAAGFVLIFLLGLGVMHWREGRAGAESAGPVATKTL